MAGNKAFLFDMDGTLLDSMGCWEKLGEAYLREHGIEPEEDLDRALSDMSMGKAALWLKERYRLAEEPGKIVSSILEIVEERYGACAPLKTGVREFLDQCRAEGVSLCVVTATPGRYAKPALKRQGVLDYFQFVLDCEAFPDGKNRPDVYDQAATRLGARPGDCVVFEDAAYAQRTASLAGYYVVGVEDAYEKAPMEERLAFCGRFICSFTELSLRDGVLTGGKDGGKGNTEAV